MGRERRYNEDKKVRHLTEEKMHANAMYANNSEKVKLYKKERRIVKLQGHY